MHKASTQLDVGISQGDLRRCPEEPAEPQSDIGRLEELLLWVYVDRLSGTPQREKMETGINWTSKFLRRRLME